MKRLRLTLFAALVAACSTTQPSVAPHSSTSVASMTTVTSTPSTPITTSSMTPAPDRVELRRKLSGGADSDAVVDCVLASVDPAVDNDTAMRVVSQGPNPDMLAEVTFADLLLSCRAAERSAR